jgi:cobalt-zinc-cadmium efflux system membrane fusion protein
VQIPVADAASVRTVADVALEIPGRPDPVTLRPEHMHDAGVVDEKTGALPVQFQIANPGGLLLVGQHATAVLYRRDKVRVPAVNRQAVLTEAGRAYVWVQVGGEQFARRYIDVATRDGDLVGIRSGVKPGDRVVIKGAYEVQLAAASKGLPAEGHVH